MNFEHFEDIEYEVRDSQSLINNNQAEVPALCRHCSQLEIITRDYELMVGCVRDFTSGPWVSEWKRLSPDITTCIQACYEANIHDDKDNESDIEDHPEQLIREVHHEE